MFALVELYKFKRRNSRIVSSDLAILIKDLIIAEYNDGSRGSNFSVPCAYFCTSVIQTLMKVKSFYLFTSIFCQIAVHEVAWSTSLHRMQHQFRNYDDFF